MSAPQTNIEKQRRRHWGPLLGIALSVILGLVMLVYWLGGEVAESDPGSPAGVVSGTTEAPAQSTIPAEVIEPDAQVGPEQSPAAAPDTRESPPVPNTPAELSAP